MIKNRGDKGFTEEKLILKNFVNYISKAQVRCLGKQNKVFFFKYEMYSCHFLIIIQYQFAINRQMKYIKKWKQNFENVTFMNKSNYCIEQTGFQASVWKIDRSYNLYIIKNILTYENELNGLRLDKDPIFNSFLLLNEDDNLIVSSIQTTIYIIIKEANENFKLQQRIKIGHNYTTFIQDYQLNDEGNVLIFSHQQRQQQKSQKEISQKILVLLRIDGVWRVMHVISLKNYSCSCFLDNDKFILYDNDLTQENLSIWQIFFEPLDVKQLKKQFFSNLPIFFFFQKTSTHHHIKSIKL